MNVYEIVVNEQAQIRIQADTAAKAKSIALASVTVRRMDVAEVIALTQRGIGIIDASTGKVIGADPEAEPQE